MTAHAMRNGDPTIKKKRKEKYNLLNFWCTIGPIKLLTSLLYLLHLYRKKGIYNLYKITALSKKQFFDRLLQWARQANKNYMYTDLRDSSGF